MAFVVVMVFMGKIYSLPDTTRCKLYLLVSKRKLKVHGLPICNSFGENDALMALISNKHRSIMSKDPYLFINYFLRNGEHYFYLS